MSSRDALGALVRGGDGCYFSEILGIVRYQKPGRNKRPRMSWALPARLIFVSAVPGDGTEWIVEFPDGYTVTRDGHWELSVEGTDIEGSAIRMIVKISNGLHLLMDAERTSHEVQGRNSTRGRQYFGTNKVLPRRMTGH